MRFQTELVPARLVRRYKRFLADCRLEADGREITAHCANPGSMTGLTEPDSKIWLEPNDDPKKKLKFGWRLVEHDDGHFTGVDTGAANRIVREGLNKGVVRELAGFVSLKAEVKYGENSRADFLLSDNKGGATWVEVKSVTLSRAQGRAEFPDSVTERGAKHLRELAQMARQGHRAVNLFCVQRTDCEQVSLADDIDPDYANALNVARDAGVEILCYGTRISPAGIDLTHPLPFVG